MSKKKKWLVGLVICLALTMVITGCRPAPTPAVAPTPTPAPEKISWRLQSLYPGGHIYQRVSAEYFCDTVRELSKGRLDITPFGHGELVPFGETTEAVSKGIIDASIWWSAYDMGWDIAAALFGCIPMGFTEHEYWVWMTQYGGLELMQELYDRRNIKVLPIGIGFTQIFGHFRKPVKSLAEMKGMVVRLSGLQAEVIKKFGVKVKFLPAGEIYTALERGIIDMAEFAGPSWNWDAGFHEVGKYILLPGWHEPSSNVVLLINKDRWNELPQDLKFIVETACYKTYAHASAFMALDDAVAMKKFKDYGCEFYRLPDEDLAKLDEATKEVLDKYAAKDPFFAKVLKSIREFKELMELKKLVYDISYEKP